MEKRGIYIRASLKSSRIAALGIGAMIIFIAMVLVAGIAAYVILTTSTQLELQSTHTGSQTITEAATGIKITAIEGHNLSGQIDKIVIIVTPRPGSPDIDLTRTQIELSDASNKIVLSYEATYWINGKSGVSDLFNAAAFSSSAAEYGVIVVIDDDSSCVSTSPIINDGDSVMLAINTTACFGGIEENVNVWGHILPEEGSWGIITFRTPSGFPDPVITLQ